MDNLFLTRFWHSRHRRIVLAQRRPVCPIFLQAGRLLSESPEMTKVNRLLWRIAKRTVIERAWVLLRPLLCRLRTPARFLAAQRYVACVMVLCAIRHKVAKNSGNQLQFSCFAQISPSTPKWLHSDQLFVDHCGLKLVYLPTVR